MLMSYIKSIYKSNVNIQLPVFESVTVGIVKEIISGNVAPVSLLPKLKKFDDFLYRVE